MRGSSDFAVPWSGSFPPCAGHSVSPLALNFFLYPPHPHAGELAQCWLRLFSGEGRAPQPEDNVLAMRPPILWGAELASAIRGPP